MATWFIVATLALSWLTSSQSVEVQLKANWEKPPFQLSILETLATESEDHYLLALAEIASFAITDPFDEDEEIEPGVWSTDQELHENTLGSFSTRDKELLDIALASKYQSPRIISHYKHYTETVIPKHGDALLKKCGTITESWVQFNNVIYCKPDDIYALMTDSTSTQEAILPFDRVVGACGPLLVFYANVNDSKFKQFASNLYDNARFAKTRFVMRYIPQFTDERETLSGYGASLNLKRYEHLVLPDQNSAVDNIIGGGGGGGGGAAEPADEIDQASPEEVKSFFGGYVDEVKPIETRNIRSLSAQAVSLLESFEDEELKFEMLKNISFNFPSFVNFIGRRVEIDGSVSELYDKNQASGIRSESTGIFLNGCPFGEKADVFQLLEALKFQLNQVDQLKEYGFSAVSAKRIISYFGSRALRSLQSSLVSRYAFSELDEVAILYLNDIKKDPEYDELMETKSNLFTTVFAVCASDYESIKHALSMYRSAAGDVQSQKIGILPLLCGGQDESLANNFYEVLLNKGPKKLAEYLEEISSSDKAVRDVSTSNHVSVLRTREVIDKFDIRKPCMIVNGVFKGLSERWYEDYTQQLNTDMRVIQKIVHGSKPGSYEELEELFHLNSFKIRHERAVPDFKREAKYKYYDFDSLIDLLEEVKHDVVEFSNFDMLDNVSKHPTDMTTFSFFDNFGSEKAMFQALKALEFIKVSDVPIRVRLVHILDSSSFVSSLKPTSTSINRSINVITDILQVGRFAEPGLLNSAFQGFMDLLDIDSSSFLLADGRYVDLRNDILDVGVLQHFLDTEKRLRLDVMSEVLKESSDLFSTIEPRDFGNWLESLKSYITSTFYSIEADSGVDYFPRFDLQSYFTGENDQDLDVLFIVDPILPLTQHLLPLVEVLKGLSFVNLVTVFAPEASIRKVDLQRFYRANVQTSVKFNSLGGVDDEVSLKFENVPEKTILRLNLETPRSWLTMVNQSLGDLENILISYSGNEKAVFELKNIIIDCDVGGSIPKNAVFEIGGGYDQSAISGSSYVQLKSNPGIWNVDLKSDESYELGHTGEINIFNFNVKENYKLSVTKRRQQSELSKGMPTKNIKSQADINIFTFASGYSQEQMLTVMMASASNTTQSSVKFWILENFMSASLRGMLPTLAENYGFEYELISFKWPVGLKSAPDRQTEFWSYKFLFLDLLFDLDLDRVIYISPDQTILHDLKELVELDLEGSPYAFPLIGEGRVETDKHKFWDLGWWRDYLEGKYNFHSTSIFVVDLNEFRSSGAGDKLRNKFNDLTDDSSAMANLDLDFPNNTQDLVPIFTLSRLWGWCETWNTIVSASDAHSIDICANPSVRERKIDSIKRLVPIWLKYYEEIEVFYNSVYPELSTFDVSEVVGTTNNEHGHDEL
ncbi:hypothetical protein WICPIJ_004844 [Wickerhamomyces pijperi]|uniref:Glycosyltransferase family 24 protein n=1 Tax=Wickerhamomyces pijperi TaxID=599730 RepID=A0A9P8TMX4_WICPI|nr:hypothetical protein WICPIJ_004844 [Wickerhamomyces pijperi]